MITEQRRDKALKYLAETDEPAAKAKARLMGLEDQKKTILATLFQEASGTQGERLKVAEAHDDYISHINEIAKACYDYEIYRNKRTTEALIVECWRSENANRRAGNI